MLFTWFNWHYSINMERKLVRFPSDTVRFLSWGYLIAAVASVLNWVHEIKNCWLRSLHESSRGALVNDDSIREAKRQGVCTRERSVDWSLESTDSSRDLGMFLTLHCHFNFLMFLLFQVDTFPVLLLSKLFYSSLLSTRVFFLLISCFQLLQLLVPFPYLSCIL